MERFKELIDLTPKHNSVSDFDIELFNADLAGLFPAPEGYKIKRFYSEGEHVFDIHGESTWQIRVQLDQSADEPSVEFDISIIPSSILARFFRNLKKFTFLNQGGIMDSSTQKKVKEK